MHWGTVTDVKILADVLDMGLIVFASANQGGSAEDSRWIYGTNFDRADYPHWMLLYNIDNVHFQLAGLAPLCGDPSTSVFRIDDVPDALKEHYNRCNGHCIMGSKYRGGIS